RLPHPSSTLFPYTTLFRSLDRESRTRLRRAGDGGRALAGGGGGTGGRARLAVRGRPAAGRASLLPAADERTREERDTARRGPRQDRKSTRLNSSHSQISYA